MSEYQVHEFMAVGRALTAREMAALRAISTRATITSRRFWNEYYWGDLKADPKKLLVRYFDVSMYAASWGSRRFMVRLPAGSVDVAAFRPYLAERSGAMTRVGGVVVLDLVSESDVFEPYEADEAELGPMVGVRAGLLRGDMRTAYLAWLLAVQQGDVEETAVEPAVPARLRALPGPLVALADFLGIDEDLLLAAGEASAAGRVGARTAGQLLARARVLAERGAREAEAEAAREVARAEAARRRRLVGLARNPAKPWAQLEKLVAARDYGEAVPLAVDLHAAALLHGQGEVFQASLDGLRLRLPSSPGFFTKFKARVKAGQAGVGRGC